MLQSAWAFLAPKPHSLFGSFLFFFSPFAASVASVWCFGALEGLWSSESMGPSRISICRACVLLNLAASI